MIDDATERRARTAANGGSARFAGGRSAPAGDGSGVDVPSADSDGSAGAGTAETDDGPEGPWDRIAPPSPSDADRTALDALATWPRRDWRSTPGVLAGALGIALLGSPTGAVAVVAFWLLGGAVYAATSVVVLYAVFEAGAAPEALAALRPAAPLLAGASVAWLLGVPLSRDLRIGTLAAAVPAAALTLGAVALGLRVGGPSIAALLLATVVGLSLYGLHRYSLVRLARGGPE